MATEFLETYLEHGYTDIIVIDYDHSESASGHVETTNETIVAKKGKKFVRAHLHEHLRFLGGPGNGISITREDITQREYLKLADGSDIADSPKALAQLHEQKDRFARQEKLRAGFIETAPPCPKCGGKMVDRKGPRGPFWGCRDFPKCKGTANFSDESRKRYKAYSESP